MIDKFTKEVEELVKKYNVRAMVLSASFGDTGDDVEILHYNTSDIFLCKRHVNLLRVSVDSHMQDILDRDADNVATIQPEAVGGN